MIQLNIFKLLIMIQPLLFSQSFYDLSIEGINGEKILFQDYKGKYVLIVNVASRCGYTSQYSDLQKLSQTYDNLVVLGVPCNQFGFQEPKSESEIFKFCSNNYDVTFPMTKKVNVRGGSQHPVYNWLTNKKLNGYDDFRISWNFNKFLIDDEGKLVGHFPSGVKPLSNEITKFLN